MSRKMMILGAGPLQVPAVRKAKELGYEVILVDYDENAVGFELADVKLVISTLDEKEVYRQALLYKPDVVLTSTSDGPVRTAAYVNEMLGKKPDLSYKDSLCATIKSDMRDRLKECRVPIPAYFAVHSVEELMEAAERLGAPFIVKPADNAGSRGVVYLDNWKDDGKLKEAYEYSRSNSRNGIVMAEEFMTGPEVSVEAMTVQGETTIVTITDKLVTPLPYFVELGHSEPTGLDEDTQQRIREVALQAVKAIRLINGPSHTEIKVTKDGPKVVELAARLGGDFITSRLVPLSTGVDMVGNSVILAAGGQTELSCRWRKGAAIRFICGGPGVIRNIVIDERIRELPGLKEYVLYKKEGDEISAARSSNDRLGHVITDGRDAEEALRRAGEALTYIHVDIEFEQSKGER